MKIWLPWCLLGLAVVLSGCRSAGKINPDISSELATSDFIPSETPPSRRSSLTFVDHPKLQSGTGAMDTDTPPEFSSTDSGLKYRILRNSNGKKPSASSTVSVNYRGWLDSGKVFDSSYERGKPSTFALHSVIDGWTEGMQLVGEGGMIELWVPSRLGYGERGSPGSIPAHSNLHFIVELVNAG